MLEYFNKNIQPLVDKHYELTGTEPCEYCNGTGLVENTQTDPSTGYPEVVGTKPCTCQLDLSDEDRSDYLKD